MGATLLEREGELEVLELAVRRARDGHGRTVLLEGAAGVGKSALIGAAGELARERGLRTLAARGGELEQEFAFGVVRQLYEPPLSAASGAERARLLGGAAAPAARLLGAAEGGPGAEAAGFAIMHALYWLAAGLATSTPLLIAVDDAHWADPSSLRALHYLARRVADLPIALLVAARPDEPGARLALLDELRGDADLRISPAGLHAASVAAVVREEFPDADEELCRACEAATAGNPLYLQELIRGLRVAGEAPTAEGVAAASLRFLGDRVLRRAARVAPDAPALVRAMAVLGNGGRLAMAAGLAGVPEAEAGWIAHRLRRIEMLGAEDPIAFVHPLVRGSVYDTLPDAERQAAHREAARRLRDDGAPAQTVASHLRMLTPSGDVEVAETLQAAAAAALARAASDEAIGWLRRALAEGAARPPRGELLATLGTVQSMQRDPSAFATLREAFELAPGAAERGRVGVLLAEGLGLAGRWSAAIDVLEASEVAAGEADGALRAEIAAVRAVIALNDPDRVADFDRRRVDAVALTEDEHWGSRALAAVLAVESVFRGRVAEGMALGERALGDDLLLAQRAGAWASVQVLMAFVFADEIERVGPALDILDEAARTLGSAFARYTVLAFRATIRARRGELTAAAGELATVFDFARQADLLMGITTTAFLLVDVLLERDDLPELLDLVEGTQLAPDFLATTSGAMLMEARGRLRLRRRDRAGGVADLRAAGAINDALGFGPPFTTWRSALALAVAPTHPDEARALAAEELELARATGLPRPQGIALRALGTITPGVAGERLLRESIAALETSPARLEHARSLVALGSALRRDNRRSEARPPLTAGVRAAVDCGAQRLADHAQQELRAAGGRRPRLTARDRDALTASELRVVRLASSGQTNVRIAQELYVSLKTVETHLTRAYLKLGLAGPGSRTRLGDALRESELV
ncbi:MAG: AAA family ATPase [Solirubrobacterales bacterium]|nr:AAA family ATPase [Solirubrobacterales bacterium]